MTKISSDVLQNVFDSLSAMVDSRAMAIKFKFKCKYNFYDLLTLSSGRAILGHCDHPAGGFRDNPAGEPELVEGVAPLLCLHLMVMVMMMAAMVIMMAVMLTMITIIVMMMAMRVIVVMMALTLLAITSCAVLPAISCDATIISSNFPSPTTILEVYNVSQ